MIEMFPKGLIWWCLIGIIMIAGCTTYPFQSVSIPPSGTDWSHRGSGVFSESSEKVFHGVGVASGIRNPLLLRSSADNLAQTEVAGVLARFVRTLAKSVAAETEVEQRVHALVQNSMADAVIVDHWKNKDTGQYYSLCRLTLKAFKSRLGSDLSMDQNLRMALLARADEWHARMVRP